MKKLLVAIATMATLFACTKKDSEPVITNPPAGKDTTKLEVSVYDATQWTKNDPYGKLKEGVTVTLYKSQDDYDQKQKAYETITNAQGIAVFKDIPDVKYFIVAQSDTLSSLLPSSTNKGVKLDTLYQTGPDASQAFLNPFPYPGNFIMKDLNGDGKFDQNDLVRIPADEATAVKEKTVSTRILIGVAYNCNYKPFASAAAAKEELDNLYNELHTWKQLYTVLDAVYTDDADCTGLPDYCQLNSFVITATDTRISDIWTKAYSIISRANRYLGARLDKIGVSDSDAQVMTAEVNMIKGYITQHLTALFGQTLQYNTILPSMTIRLTDATNSRIASYMNYNAADDFLPHISTTNKHRFTYEASQALLARLAWERNDYDVIKMLCEKLLALSTFKAGTTNLAAYTDPANTENLFCDNRVISNNDLKTIFKKGNYLSEIHYSEIVILKAVSQLYLAKVADIPTILNPLRSRSGKDTFANPTSIAEAMKFIRQTYKDELSIEGLTMAHITHPEQISSENLINVRLLPLAGFKQYNSLLPIPVAVLNTLPFMIQNPGY